MGASSSKVAPGSPLTSAQKASMITRSERQAVDAGEGEQLLDKLGELRHGKEQAERRVGELEKELQRSQGATAKFGVAKFRANSQKNLPMGGPQVPAAAVNAVEPERVSSLALGKENGKFKVRINVNLDPEPDPRTSRRKSQDSVNNFLRY